MSEDPTSYGTRTSVTDGEWSARYAISCEPKRMAVIVEPTVGANSMVIPLTAPRVRALILLLHDMLTEAGEETGVWPTGQQPDGSWVLDRDHDRPVYTRQKNP